MAGLFCAPFSMGWAGLYTILVVDLLKLAFLGVECRSTYLGLSTIYV